MKVLALSSSRVGNGGYLEEAAILIQQFLGKKQLTIAFIPFASVDRDYEEYGSKVQNALSHLPYLIQTITGEDNLAVLDKADVIMTGGGNTFKLLHDLYKLGLLQKIRGAVSSGKPYIGWSAGANIAGQTICTTNDMPIIQPESFKALGFLPFQINPHYLNQKTDGFNGETRDQRLEEFVKMNPGKSVLGLPEGTALWMEEKKLQFVGKLPAVHFGTDHNNNTIRTVIQPGENLSDLLKRSESAER